MQPDQAIKVVRDTLEWGSRVGRKDIPINRSDFSQHFTENFAFTINNVVKCRGIDAMMDRVREMFEQASEFDNELLTPCFSDGNHVAGYAQYRFTSKTGEKGLVHTCTTWTLRDGRIDQICEVAAFEDLRMDLASYGDGAGTRCLE